MRENTKAKAMNAPKFTDRMLQELQMKAYVTSARAVGSSIEHKPPLLGYLTTEKLTPRAMKLRRN